MEGFRVFEYSRKDKDTGEIKYRAQLIVKGYDVICFGDTTLPAGISEEAALKFFDDAEKAVLRKIDGDWEDKTAGG